MGSGPKPRARVPRLFAIRARGYRISFAASAPATLGTRIGIGIGVGVGVGVGGCGSYAPGKLYCGQGDIVFQPVRSLVLKVERCVLFRGQASWVPFLSTFRQSNKQFKEIRCG